MKRCASVLRSVETWCTLTMQRLRTKPASWSFAIALFAVTALPTAHAQSVRWESADSGDPSELQLIFDDCAPEGEPQLPRIEGVTLTLAGTASQTTMNNFSFSRSTIMTYRARAQKSGSIQIPTFTVQTNKGAIRVPAFNGGAARSAADANIVSRLEPAATSIWAGEVFPLAYVLDVARRSFNQLGSPIEWNASPLVVEDWSKFEPSEAVVGGESRLRITSNTRAYAKAPGQIALNSANQLVNIQSGSVGFGLFQTPRIEQLSVTSNRPTLTVRALPTPTIAGFSGAVGQFKLTSKVVPTTAAVGEPVTWTLELSGTGNWPEIAGLPSRDVSKDFSVVQPQAKRTPAEGKLFDVVLSEDVVLVPTKEGNYTLGPVEFVYFDPASGSYKTAITPRTNVTISPAPVTSPATPSSAAPSTISTDAPKQDRKPTSDMKPPAAPQGIPRDPLTGESRSLVPMPLKKLLTLVAVPFPALPLLWAWFALTRAKRTDPLRPKREAHARLAAHLVNLRTAGDDQRSKLLLAWQHDTAVLWGLSHAAPRSLALQDPAWAALWAEADQTLYSSRHVFPSDWVARATTALAEKRVRSFSPLRLFLPQNLLPFVAALVFSVWITPEMFAAASDSKNTATPETAYRSGNFAAAEKGWSERVAKSPTDSIARYNLSLALAQQDRWGEATVHAAAAFVQSPSDSPARWQLALAAEKAGFMPAPIVRFLPPGPFQSLASLGSPGAWQILLICASCVFVTALGLLLYGAYHSKSRARTFSALALLTVGTGLAAASASSLQTFGVAADERAVIAWRAGILRSIPTEADTTQKTTALGAGSTGFVDKTFLGWVRLNFENGQTGWLRKEEVIPLWH